MEEVKINGQVWMRDNLNVETFRNGERILQAQTKEEWVQAGINGQPAWCFVNNPRSKSVRVGKLYNWYAVYDPRGLAPTGWKVPNLEDLKVLKSHLYSQAVDEYYDDNANGRWYELRDGGRSRDGSFYESDTGSWWSSTFYLVERLDGVKIPNAYSIDASSIHNRCDFNIATRHVRTGMTVRCIKEDTRYEIVKKPNTVSIKKYRFLKAILIGFGSVTVATGSVPVDIAMLVAFVITFILVIWFNRNDIHDL